MPIGLIKLLPLLLDDDNGVNFLFQNTFSTDESAPVSSPVSGEVGELTLTQNDGNFSIDAGYLKSTGQTTFAVGDLLAVSASQTRAAGLAAGCTILAPSGDTDNANNFAAGWGANTIWVGGASDSEHAVAVVFRRLRLYVGTTLTRELLGAGSYGETDIDCVIALQSTGADYWLKGDNLNANWTLYYRDRTRSAASLKAGFEVAVAPSWLSYLAVQTYPALDASSYETTLSGTLTVSDTWESDAGSPGDQYLQVGVTRPSSGNLEFSCRKVDTNNRYQLLLDSAGTLTVNEILSGSPSTIATLGSVGATDTLHIIFEGTTLRVFRSGQTTPGINITGLNAGLSGEQSNTYEASGTGGALSNLVSSVRLATGTQLTALNALLNT